MQQDVYIEILSILMHSLYSSLLLRLRHLRSCCASAKLIDFLKLLEVLAAWLEGCLCSAARKRQPRPYGRKGSVAIA